MAALFVRKALLADGWSEAVRLHVANGRIADVETGATPEGADVVGGIAIPGLVNAHSHAFQRALVGRTEERAPAVQDTFWTWRSRMYALAHRIDAGALLAIARQAYCEMVAAGFTGVAEFHYLLSEPGEPRPGMAMLHALAAAAADSGIRLAYVPVLYERAGFDDPEPNADQRRFATTLDAFEAHYRQARDEADGYRVGIGAHSLRAVTAGSLARVARIAAEDRVPMHIHVAEQQREVEQCLAVLGERPVRWLLREHEVDERWCLVHATHVDDEEVEKLAQSGAVACLCPSTEANLGDGLFPLARYLEHGGRIAIGSDSHVSINPFEELRWLEYGQRLVSMRRNVAAHGDETHTGRSLFALAAEGGALAAGIPHRGLARGAPADLVVLDDDSPMLVGHEADSLLDALVFSGFTLPIDRVMVGGEWRVVDGRHVAAEDARREYARTVRRLFA
ncbi:MAG TPA: formimidoylglutamate deiminase [Woeseiaceae bacterium]|nr:formimidoylglutamate deiminase [Woeseiaceae bacterium]